MMKIKLSHRILSLLLWISLRLISGGGVIVTLA
jgi:hypothetical protein